MACRKSKTKRELNAKLVTEADQRTPCVFCNREVDDEVIYGKLYAIGDIQIHYFCALLSCCLIQKAKDDVGLFGFLYTDILAEVERSKKHRCSYCGRGGANLGCSVGQCRKQFHLPCGREKNAVSMFYGNYKSFCQLHAPRQKIPDNIMANVKLRKPSIKIRKEQAKLKEENLEVASKKEALGDAPIEDCMVCVICYEEVVAAPSVDTFWPPCCARDAWFHRNCLQRMSLSAGMHYLKCPLCNDKDTFQRAVVEQGYYIPDRDAAWELEQNAFAEIYERALSCTVQICLCPEGRGYDSDQGEWDIKLCLLCGTQNAHAKCVGMAERFICDVCKPAAPKDIDALHDSIQDLIRQEQSRTQASRRRPVMPCRMSLRRTKQLAAPQASTSRATEQVQERSVQQQTQEHAAIRRLDFNTKPKHPKINLIDPTQPIENILLSPLKLLEQGLQEKISKMNVRENVSLNSSFVMDLMRQKFRKPKPMSEKRRIVNEILEGLFENMGKESPKTKQASKEWTSPRKGAACFEDSEVMVIKNPVTPKKELIETTIPNDNIVFIGHDKEIAEPMEVDKGTLNKVIVLDDDDEESSRSTFELPPEFIAEDSNSFPLTPFTPQKATTIIDIRNDSSIEISEHEESVKIDVITIEDNSPDPNPEITKTCAFKFSPVDNETLWSKNVNLDVECFKNKYLSEVKKEDAKCNFGHKHVQSDSKKIKLRTAIDFAIDAAIKENKIENKSLKRKLDMDETNENSKIENVKNSERAKRKKKKKKESRKRNKNLKTHLSVRNKDIKLKFKFKEKQFKVKISRSKSSKSKNKKSPDVVPKKMQQYILQYDVRSDVKEQIVKPDSSVTPMKKKKIKSEKTPDNLKQTSIQSFFVVK